MICQKHRTQEDVWPAVHSPRRSVDGGSEKQLLLSTLRTYAAGLQLRWWWWRRRRRTTSRCDTDRGGGAWRDGSGRSGDRCERDGGADQQRGDGDGGEQRSGDTAQVGGTVHGKSPIVVDRLIRPCHRFSIDRARSGKSTRYKELAISAAAGRRITPPAVRTFRQHVVR